VAGKNQEQIDNLKEKQREAKRKSAREVIALRAKIEVLEELAGNVGR